ncbi:50S ribosomal protein L1 [Fulvivirga ligni]|uniref:50S ribosomal protein L1 n=1 Tax=Fulvivirga ligni TaxID=2904246 RepID=UPI001F3E4619|nr:50S ribosomal protein L1 [Fulvivirga ligni]UII21801.1 50S ribosomal protein L1 [Fulvivirga ligni]
MAKLTKNQKIAREKVDSTKEYALEEASNLVKEISLTKFDSSVDLDIRLGVDPKKADQMVRGVVTLPHGTGKDLKVLVLCTPDKEEEAKAAGADYVGLDDYIKKIEGGWTDVDVIITMPTVMAKVGRLGRVLGPRGLMPNPKSGTVTLEVGKAVQDIKAGKIDFKVDKFGIIHCSVGKASFTPEKIRENIQEMISTVAKLKPASAKGTYFRSINISSTMSPSITIDKSSISGLKS